MNSECTRNAWKTAATLAIHTFPLCAVEKRSLARFPVSKWSVVRHAMLLGEIRNRLLNEEIEFPRLFDPRSEQLKIVQVEARQLGVEVFDDRTDRFYDLPQVPKGDVKILQVVRYDLWHNEKVELRT